MRALIRPWQPANTYSYGDIVQFDGMTYQAEANDVRLIAPDRASTGLETTWRPLVRIGSGKTLSRPEFDGITAGTADITDGGAGTADIEKGSEDPPTSPNKRTRRKK